MKIEEMIAKNRANCSGCEACANICPKHCIEMKPDREGFYYPNINKAECIKCGQCDNTCPVLNHKEPVASKLPTALAAINKDWNIRRNSSSGGVFTALAEIILNRGGMVFGVAFNDDWQVVHIATESMEELTKIRGSKYVQSRIGDIYRQVKTQLEKGRQVLFSGTPCQVVGLKYFLKKDYINLILIDIVCKGVPSPILWNNYINYRTRGHKVTYVTFRDKQKGWENSLFKIIFTDRGMYSSEINKDLFVQGFGLALNIRPSCHECHFKGLTRFSDITLADFWGVRNVLPEMYDNKGTSLILVHSEKAIKLLNEAGLIMKEANLKKAVEANPCSIVSCPADPRRDDFFNDLARFNPISVMDKYYLYDISQQAQQLFELINRNRLLKWLEIERKFDLFPKENVLIVTMREYGGSNAFVEQYVKKNIKKKGVYILNQYSENGIDKFIISDLRHNGLMYNVEKNYNSLTRFLQNVKITHIFVNHLIRFDLQFIMNWILSTKLPFTFFIHDYFCVCPNYLIDCNMSFCSENKVNKLCRNYFNEVKLPNISVENWREVFHQFLSKAEHIYTPSTYTANIVKKIYPNLNIESKPHYLELPFIKTFRSEFALRDRIRIIFLGLIRKEKGEKYLLLANKFIRENNLPIDLVVLGEIKGDEKNIDTKEGITVTGRYNNKMVSELLAQCKTALVATLSDCNETYCYTASEAILSGYPVLAMDIGAHSLRIKKHDCGWIIPINTPSNGFDELKNFLKFIVTPEGRQQILLKANNTNNFVNGTE